MRPVHYITNMYENPTKKYTILFIITQSSWGGAQAYVYDLAVSLFELGWNVSVAAGEDPNGELIQHLHEKSVPTYHLSSLTRNIDIFKNLRAVHDIFALIKKINPDIVHCNSSMAGTVGAIAAKIAHIPGIVFTAHGFVTKEPLPWHKIYLYRSAERARSIYTRHTICVSRDDYAHGLEKGYFKSENATVIPVALKKTPVFLSRHESRKALKQMAPGIDESAPWIMSIGYFYANKGFTYLIDAIALLQKKNMHLQCIFIGDGKNQFFLKNKVKISGLARLCFFTGALPHAAQYLKAADAFVLPSLKEGYPYTLLEAKAAGVPVVASRVGGVPEALNGYTNATLVPPADASALASAIEKSLTLNQENTQSIPSNNYQAMLDATIEVYRRATS